MYQWRRNLSGLIILTMVAAACGSDDGDSASTTTAPTAATETVATTEGVTTPTPSEPLEVIATTTILGDLVANIVGSDAEVEVLLPPGADPHDYQISSSDAARLYEVDLVVANGLGLEESLIAVLETAEDDGVNVLEISNMLDPIPFSFEASHEDEDNHGDEDDHDDEDSNHDDEDDHENEDSDHDDEGDHDDDEDSDHDDEGDHDDDEDSDHDDEGDHDDDEDSDHDDEGDHDDDEDSDHDDDDDHEEEGHAHDPSGLDPHFWTDPLRVGRAGLLIAEALAAIDPSVDWRSRAEEYATTMAQLDEEIQDLLAAIPEDDRKLVTNHDSLGYFADRYGFEIIGTVIPGGATLANPSSAEMANLIGEVIEEDIKAIFAETIEPTALAEAIAEAAGTGVTVVTLYTGSLGEPGTETDNIVGMLRSNARQIAEALS